MAESSIRDALLAEALGDLGKLLEAVESLKDTLPPQVEEVEAHLMGLITQLNKAGTSYREVIHEYMNVEANKARERIAGELRNEVKAVLLTQLSAPMSQVIRMNRASVWRTLGVAMVGGIVVLLGAHLLGYHFGAFRPN